MGQIADDIIEGFCCALCGQYFDDPHGYPVACDECYEDEHGYPLATEKLL